MLNKREEDDLLSVKDLNADVEEERYKHPPHTGSGNVLWDMLGKLPSQPFKKSRTLSDSVTYSKPLYNKNISASSTHEDDVLKIDSNYSEAIEEVII